MRLPMPMKVLSRHEELLTRQNMRRQRFHTVSAAVLVACTFAPPVNASVSGGAAETAAEIIGDADVVYSTSFVMRCSEDTWERLVDRPALLGRLWNAYGFAPTYQVEMRHDTVHVEDSTGLVGDVVTVELGPGRWQYLINGELDHWAVPFFNEGTAVLVVETEVKGDGIAGTATIHLRANSGIGRVVLRAAGTLLTKHVANRLDLNLQDAAKIFAEAGAHGGTDSGGGSCAGVRIAQGWP